MRLLRGKRIGFIFQDPMTSLNPTLTVGYQIAESAKIHMGLSRKQADDRAAELLSKVDPARPGPDDDYPHQFSGGMRQRVMIAIALACDPMLLLADEPTTALDVTIQAQILELIRSLSEEFETAVILITHDLGIAAGMCNRVNVMYAGRIVETDRWTTSSTIRACHAPGACSTRCRAWTSRRAPGCGPSRACRRTSSTRGQCRFPLPLRPRHLPRAGA